MLLLFTLLLFLLSILHLLTLVFCSSAPPACRTATATLGYIVRLAWLTATSGPGARDSNRPIPPPRSRSSPLPTSLLGSDLSHCSMQQGSGLPFNRYSWLTTHNSFARLGQRSRTGAPILSPANQQDSVTDQLNVSYLPFARLLSSSELARHRRASPSRGPESSHSEVRGTSSLTPRVLWRNSFRVVAGKRYHSEARGTS